MFLPALLSIALAAMSPRMVNGTKPAADHPAAWSAVALIDKDSGEPFCSATLIAEHLIVTAAHCVFDKKPGDFQILAGSVRLDPETLATLKKEQKFESNFDIAWVRFTGTVPAGMKPIEIWHQPVDLKAATPLSIAGYGRTATDCLPGDSSCAARDLLMVNTNVREFVDQGRLSNLLVIGPQPEHGPCFGDSGGPAYLQKDGRWYLVGAFMGWDRILVPENLENICDTGEAIYTYVGAYASWIEETSQTPLTYDAGLNPRQPEKHLDSLAHDPRDFLGWCAYNNHEDPAWFTVQRLIRIVSDDRLRVGDGAAARAVFEDCAAADAALREMLDRTHSLSIGGYDPSTFIDRAPLEDIRPLRALQEMGLTELSLSDHAIADWLPLRALAGLKKLTLVNNGRESTREPLVIGDFPELEFLQLSNPGPGIDLSALNQLHQLRSLELNYVDATTLPPLTGMILENLHLDTLDHAAPLDLSPATNVRTLFLNKIAVHSLPPAWPNLESLDLLETTGLDALPVDAPRLKRIFVYASADSTSLSVGSWPVIEEISFFGNPQVARVEGLHDLATLKFLEVAENQKLTQLAIYQLPLVQNLALTGNQLKVLDPLVGLPVVTKLHLEGNQLPEVPDLKGLPKLQYLDLSENPLTSVARLHDVATLKRLVLQGTKLPALTGIGNLPALIEVNLASNALTGVEDLLVFPALQVLILNDNKITDISALGALARLNYLEVINNPLVDRTCPIRDKPDACRFEWLNFSPDQPMISSGARRSPRHL